MLLRRLVLILLARAPLTLSRPLPLRADWLPGGVRLCDNCYGDLPRICADGTGGAFATWRDNRGGGNMDAYAQHVTALGTIATGWPTTAMPVGTGPTNQTPEAITPDGFGGAIVTWQDWRVVGSPPDIYVQRINADGTLAPGWPTNGTPAAQRLLDYDWLSQLAPDGAGGALIAWESEDTSGVQRILVQHLTGTGSVAPGWPAPGLPLSSLGAQTDPTMVGDGEGGAMVVWNDLTRGGIWAQRVTAAGAIAPGWDPDGVNVVLGRYLRSAQSLVADHAGGAFIACSAPHPVYTTQAGNHYVQRFSFAGAVVPGWPEGGAPVCTAPGPRSGMATAPDGAGGVLLTWFDSRDPSSSGVYALRVRPDQSIAPGWTTNGTLVSAQPYFQVGPEIAPDGTGGAYLCWRIEFDSGDRAYVQHLTSLGVPAPGWLPGGVPASTGAGHVSQREPRIVADSLGGAIVVWDDPLNVSVYAQRFGVDGPVAVAVSLVSAEAISDRVTLAWHEAGDRLPATLYRRSGVSEWATLARLNPDGEGFLRYEDRDVIPGTRYGYRLGIVESGAEEFVGEVSLEVPAVSQLALRGVSPNPAVHDLNVAFSLPGGAPARLELIDIAGRRVKSEEVGSLGAGNHVLNVNRDGQLAAGVYLVRLAQGARSATARAIVVR